MITFVTGNRNKAEEAAEFFKGITEINHVSFDAVEPQSDNCGDVARAKAEQAYDALKIPVIADDTGFFIESLNGFPGVYASYVLDTIGISGILHLLDKCSSRKAYFITALAYSDDLGTRVFYGRVDGIISEFPRGDKGFGYDPIFEVDGRTFAEMDIDEKNTMSHRAKALSAFRDWYIKK